MKNVMFAITKLQEFGFNLLSALRSFLIFFIAFSHKWGGPSPGLTSQCLV